MILRSIQVGVARSFGTEGAENPLDRPWTSGIVKQPVSGAVWAGRLGMAGDIQVDRRVHGGVDKAVLAYGLAHYSGWRSQLERPEVGPGWFGENLTIEAADERTVCIGDRFAIGPAHFEVSQPRGPCSTLNRRFHRRDMVKLVQERHAYGWYFRVLVEGWVEAGMPLRLLDRPYPQWPVRVASEVRAERASRPDEARRFAACPALSASWRGSLTAAAAT